jgi:beta-glucosidase
VAGLSLAERAALLSGENVWQTRAITRIGWPSIWLADGPHGVRKQTGRADHLGLGASLPATCFPTAAGLANSWNIGLLEEVGQALGREARQQGVQVLLGPGLNLKRNPLGGRTFEYFSEDPLLSGELAAAQIRGIQSQGVSAAPKHFAANSQETNRMVSDSVIDERTLRELYLRGFEIALRQGQPWALMTSYNLVNGEQASESRFLLSDILRGEWAYDGLVVTDWGGGRDPVKAVLAGATLEMPSPGFDSAQTIVAAVKAGQLPEASLDARVMELLRLIRRLQSSSRPAGATPASSTPSALAPATKPGATPGRRPEPADTRPEPPSTRPESADTRPESADAARRAQHHALARRAATESCVLLKNDSALLPLPPGTSVALIGDFARQPRYQGAGSSLVNPYHLTTLLQTLQAGTSGLTVVGFAPGFDRRGRPDSQALRQAATLARRADVGIVCLGLPEAAETEGIDRTSLALPQGQQDLLAAVAEANPAVICVIQAGGVVEMPWRDHCRGLIHAYLGGQAGAEALVDILTGQANPSGKLAETIPQRQADLPSADYYPAPGRTAEYREGLYTGYRYYESAGIDVCYEFGFGLSYTSFEYSGLTITPTAARFTIKNTGSVKGAETAQLYTRRVGPSAFHRPAKELRGFAKVTLDPGASQVVQIPLSDKDLRLFDPVRRSWLTEPGEYEVLIGASVRDIRLRAARQTGTQADTAPVHDPALEPYFSAQLSGLDSQAFSALLRAQRPVSQAGRPVAAATAPDQTSDQTSGQTPDQRQNQEPDGDSGKVRRRRLTPDDPLSDLVDCASPVGRMIFKVLDGRRRRAAAKGEPDLNSVFVLAMPLRGIAKMSGGRASMELAEALLVLINGQHLRGLGQAVRALLRNSRRTAAYRRQLDQAGTKQ